MDILKKEKELHKINQQIEEKTKLLLRQAEDAKKFQETLLKDATTKLRYNKPRLSRSALNLDEFEGNVKMSFEECKDLNMPEDVNNMGVKGFMSFLKAKAKKLQFDYDKLLVDFKAKIDENNRLQNHNKRLTEERERWLQNLNATKTSQSKLENQLTVSKNKAQCKDNEIMTLKRSIDALEKEAKNAKLMIARAEQKCNKLSDECERLKHELKTCKQQEKDLREEHNKKITDLNSCIDKLEKQKLYVINGFKKQLALIDNLKRQKAHIECIKITEHVEQDLLNLLNLKLEK